MTASRADSDAAAGAGTRAQERPRRPRASSRFALGLALALALITLTSALTLSAPATACLPQDVANANAVTIGKPTYVCLVINDRNVTVTQPTADTFTRVVMQGSFNATLPLSNQPACSGTRPGSSFWFPTGCPNSGRIPTSGLGGPPATNFYVSSMGVNSQYKKAYVRFTPGTSTISHWFPIVTAVIEVNMGTVVSVYWDDGCYFCPWNNGVTGEQANPTVQRCLPNAYVMATNAVAKLSNKTNSDYGSDCGLTLRACPSNSNALCDLGVYVVWTGTDSAGHQFASAGRRFRRFRMYNMAPQYEAMKRFGGNDLTKSTTPSITNSPDVTAPPVAV